MLQAPQRTALSGPALVRLLARFADVDVSEPRQSLSDRLSQWLGWTDAIALSSALTGAPPAVPAGARSFGSAEEAECARVRASLVNTITGDSAFATSKRRGPAYREPPAVPVDYVVFRQRYQAMQQSMETAVGSLRGRLRALLAAKTPAMGRLAVLDAVMERALAERERSLFASLPALLAGHFERLRDAAQQAEAAAPAADEGASAAAAVPAASGHWLDAFRQDMLSVLLAELDVRLQPVEGLLAALRTR
ncbi:DUF3348 domain-containing protein [Paraburkholderia phenoliruptrix]|uniref:DUF3348 domain-containing protein n=1 Tax=Paraburkholderia phenoliruptrix TaxID=252970 RepID=UPI0001C02184|nr:DUF3348 domain-containing protein [Paraburkholderia phenoliruptrix]WMY12055.1 DUF3348 domain-containing protein [Paraburkholderia phenoliruptrix]